MKKMSLESAFGDVNYFTKIHQEVAEIHKFLFNNKTNGRRTIKNSLFRITFLIK
jgi:hypothetical protein